MLLRITGSLYSIGFLCIGIKDLDNPKLPQLEFRVRFAPYDTSTLVTEVGRIRIFQFLWGTVKDFN